MDKETCTRCDKPLTGDKIVWLELDIFSGKYYPDEGHLLPRESQGLFPFGFACAKRALKENTDLRSR